MAEYEVFSLEERRQTIDDVIRFKPTSRIPNFSNFWTWMLLDYKPNLYDVAFDYAECEKAFDAFADTYQFDAYADMGYRNCFPVGYAANDGDFLFHKINAAGDAVEVEDYHLMEPEEYGEFCDNLLKFQWEHVGPRTMGQDVTYEKLADVVRACMDFNAFRFHMENSIAENHQALSTRVGGLPIPLEMMFSFYRGIREVSLDLRRRRKELHAACDAILNSFGGWGIYDAILSSGNPNAMTGGCITMLAHSVLNPKQFGEFYWPYYQYIIDQAVKQDKTLFVFCEGEIMRFAEYFEQVPKGTMMVQLEQDDIFEVRKRLPNLALCGGLPVSLLGNGTPTECVDYVKRLVDELGTGFMLSTNKMVSFKGDCKRENLLAVNEYIRNLRV